MESRQVIYHFKARKLENSKYNLFHEILRFHNSKEAVMISVKYIVTHILAKFIYFAKQIIFCTL